MFDAISPAVTAADHVVGTLMSPDRAARLVEQKSLDPTLPGLEDVIDALFAASFGATARTPYEAEVKRAVERVVVDELMDLAANAPMSQVRAIATLKLQRRGADAGRVLAGAMANSASSNDAEVAHSNMLALDINRFLTRPANPVAMRFPAPGAPPGAPIGEPAMSWLQWLEPDCTWIDWSWWRQ
jgi:hypothetical protein